MPQKKRTASVPKTFDDQLEGFIKYVKKQRWQLTGTTVSELEKDLKKQREDKQTDLDLERQYDSFHGQFLTAQAARYQRYMKALEVARAAHRDDKDVLKALDQFKRKQAPRKPGGGGKGGQGPK